MLSASVVVLSTSADKMPIGLVENGVWFMACCERAMNARDEADCGSRLIFLGSVSPLC